MHFINLPPIIRGFKASPKFIFIAADGYISVDEEIYDEDLEALKNEELRIINVEELTELDIERQGWVPLDLRS